MNRHIFSFEPHSENLPMSFRRTKIKDGFRLVISYLEGLGIVLDLCSKNKGTDQLRSYCAAYLGLCFHICKKQVLLKAGLLILTIFDEKRDSMTYQVSQSLYH